MHIIKTLRKLYNWKKITKSKMYNIKEFKKIL